MRNPLTVDGLTYPVRRRRYSQSAVTIEALHPITGRVVASGPSRGDLVASIRRSEGCGEAPVKDTESLDRVIPRTPDQQQGSAAHEGATDNQGSVELGAR